MARQDKTIVKIKDYGFSVAKESGKIVASGTIEISEILYNEDNTIKSISRREGVIGGAGFKVSEAFINMLDDIEDTIKPSLPEKK